MRIEIIALLIGGLLFSCTARNTESPQEIFVTGNIANFQGSTAILKDGLQNTIAEIPVDSNGNFQKNVVLETGYYNLSFQDQYAPLFLAPGDTLTLSTNYNAFDSLMQYSGSAGPHCSFLLQADAYRFRDPALVSPFGYAYLPEEEFLSVADSFYQGYFNLLDSAEGLSPTFLKWQRASIKADQQDYILNYPRFKKHIADTTYSPSANYPNIEAEIQEDATYAWVPAYLDLIRSMLENQLSDSLGGDYSVLEYLDHINKSIQSQELKNNLAYLDIKWSYKDAEPLDSTVAYFKSMCTNTQFITDLDQKVKQLEAIAPGQPAPDFTLLSATNDSVSLSDFKDQVVYIDVWATWCQPCIMEIPALKKLKTKYRNTSLAVVSFCYEDEETSWRKALDRYGLSGVQLFSKNSIPFTETFQISSWPTYILIDQDGLIVDSDAKRPADPELHTQLDRLLGISITPEVPL